MIGIDTNSNHIQPHHGQSENEGMLEMVIIKIDHNHVQKGQIGTRGATIGETMNSSSSSNHRRVHHNKLIMKSIINTFMVHRKRLRRIIAT